MSKICTFDGCYASYCVSGNEHFTTRFHPGAVAAQDLGAYGTRPICYKLRPTGVTVTWARSDDPAVVAKTFAKDIGAKLLTEAEYNSEVARMRDGEAA